MLAVKSAGQRLIACLYDNAVPDPLPELGLRGPELAPVTADDERRLPFLFLLLVLVLFDVFLHVLSIVRSFWTHR
ncbi:MAG: hypothetical protein JWM21_1388 [Acidobacteria bacterium]|nr:hypothetical protein [Acidobacteriota bacterium]